MAEIDRIFKFLRRQPIGEKFRTTHINTNKGNSSDVLKKLNCVKKDNGYFKTFNPTPNDLTGCKGCYRLTGPSSGCPIFEKAYTAS